MRFLHTSDWHLGRTMRNQSRQTEFEAALDAVVRIAIDSRVDAVLVAGDVFDSFSPPAEAEQLLNESLLRLVEARIPVVMVAGNHDPAARFDAWAGMVRLGGIHLLGRIPDEVARVHITIPSREGHQTARIVALPWVPERNAIPFEALQGGRAQAARNYGQRLASALDTVWHGADPRQVNIFLGHLMIDGAFVGANGGERALTVGETFALRPAVLPESAQYVALGHVHKPQLVSHPSNAAYYSGSLLQLDFGEAGQAKSVNLFEVEAGLPARGIGDAGSPLVRLEAGRQLRDLTVDLADLPAAGAGVGVGDAFLRVTVRTPQPTRGLYEQVLAVLPNAVEVKELVEGAAVPDERDLASRSGRDPADLFAEFVSERRQAPPPADLLAAFKSLHAEVMADAPA